MHPSAFRICFIFLQCGWTAVNSTLILFHINNELFCFQDILRLLTLWFNHGATPEVQLAMQEGFAHVNINTWLVVLPQIIARIHSNNHAVRKSIQLLLVQIGRNHPQVWFRLFFPNHISTVEYKSNRILIFSCLLSDIGCQRI